MNQQQLQLSTFQRRVLELPEEFDLFLGGGRGGAKSYALALIALRHASQYGHRARVLYIRATYKGLADFELLTRELFGTVYGTAAAYNASEHVWRVPNGAYLELGQLESMADYTKYQGRSFTLLLVDEAGQYARPDLLDMLRSNLRGPRDIPIRVVMAANPGGVGHFWVAQRYVFRAEGPWRPFREPKSGREWVYCPSTYLDNPFIDQAQYADQLTSACPEDPELLRAWLTGDWTVARGAYFGGCLDEARNAIPHWQKLPEDQDAWDCYLAHDFGSTAPSVTYLCAQSPGAAHEGRFYPRGSIVLVDELAAVRRDNLSMGLGWTAATTAEAIRELCAKWAVPAEGVADDACFARTGHGATIADEFARGGVRFQPAKKADRVSGWQLLRRLLADAGKPDVPGLYVSRACAYFWATVPYLARDQKRVEDVDSSGPDHAADAARYACLRLRRESVIEPLRM